MDPKYSMWISTDPALGDYIPKAPINEEAKKHNQNLPGMGGVFNHINGDLYAYAGNNPVRYIDPDGRDINPSNMGLKPEIRQQMNSLSNLESVANRIKQSKKSNGIDLKLFYTNDYCWARASIIREEIEGMGYEVDGYSIVLNPLKYDAKQKVKNGELDPNSIPKSDSKNRFSYHVGVTVKIGEDLYVVDPFYDEHTPGLSSQKDWIESQFGISHEYQKKNSKYGHLNAFKYFPMTDVKNAYNYSVKELNSITR